MATPAQLARLGTVRLLDPTRTITMRRAFSRSLNILLRSLLRDIIQVVVVEDGFGLKTPSLPVLLNQTYSRSLGTNVHSYSSTQVNITDREVLREIQRIQSLIEPSDVIKVEDVPHITVRYGLFDQPRMVDAVRTMVSGTGEAVARVGSLSLFEQDEQDVLKFDVESQHLTRLNERLGLLPNHDKYSTYHPHVTVAYLNKGTGGKYLVPSSITGRRLVFSDIMYLTTEGEKTSIDLTGPLITNQRWKYKSQDEAADGFEKWLQEHVSSSLTSPVEAARWRRYVKRGFETGANRALNDVKRGTGRGAKALRYIDGTRGAGYVEGQRETFLRTTLGRATAAEKLRALESQALSEVKGLSAEIVTRARRVVVDSLIRNLSPRELGERLSSVLKVSQGRARTIANTELVRAHAEGQLTAMEELGVEKVGVAVEWSSLKTACKLCSTLNGVVLTVKEARGMLPRHPNCRCAWKVANVGESAEEKKKGQKRSKTKIDKAVKRSQREGGDDWGPAKEIARTRPTVLNCGGKGDKPGPCPSGIRDHSSYEIIVTSDNRDEYHTYFKTRNGERVNVRIGRDERNTWGIEFTVGGSTFATGRSGTEAIRIMRTVGKIVDKFIVTKRPAAFEFTADASEGKRVSLYDRLARTLGERHNYKLTRTDKTSTDEVVEYKFTKPAVVQNVAVSNTMLEFSGLMERLGLV